MNTLAALFSTIQAMYPELTEENILLHGVLPGPINTDMNAGLKIEMVSPESVANAILDGIVNEDEDIFSDPVGKQIGRDWLTNPKHLEKRFSQ